ncbi:uncharacterized protein J3R85_008741 [Psidium guajava]|nr:uncharacterized protein J3R85_008741 [Psidium guajava]
MVVFTRTKLKLHYTGPNLLSSSCAAALVAEDDLELARRGALVHQRRAVVRERERGGAGALEELRVARRPARVFAVVVVPAAQLVGPERLAPALARHHGAVPRRRPHLQLRRARRQQVGPAAHDGAHALPLVRRHRHGDVEAVHEADAVGGEVGVALVEAELGEGGWSGAAEAPALEAAAAVAGGAGEAAAMGMGAVGAGPDAAGPGGVGGGEGAVGEGGEGEATALEDGVAGVGLDGRPHREGAVVDQGQSECLGEGGGTEEEEEEEVSGG